MLMRYFSRFSGWGGLVVEIFFKNHKLALDFLKKRKGGKIQNGLGRNFKYLLAGDFCLVVLYKDD